MSFVLVVRMKTTEGNDAARGRGRPRARRGLARRAGLQGLRPVRRPRGLAARSSSSRSTTTRPPSRRMGRASTSSGSRVGELFPLMESRERTFYETLLEAVEEGAVPRRAVPRGAGAAPAARRHRPAAAADPARPRRHARRRRPARHDPGALHGPLRAAGAVPVAAASAHGSRSRAALGLIGVFGVVRALAPGALGVILADVPDRHRHGAGGGDAPRRGEAAVRRPARLRDGGLHVGNHDRLRGRRERGGAARARRRRLAHTAARLRRRLDAARRSLALAHAQRAAARAGRRATAEAPVATAARLAPGGRVLPHVVRLLRAQRVAARRLRRARVERRLRREPARSPEHRHDPGRVRRRLGRRPLGAAPDVARRGGDAAARRAARCRARARTPAGCGRCCSVSRSGRSSR